MQLSPERKIALTGTALIALGALIAVLAGWGSPPWWAFFGLTAAAVVTERASVRIVLGGQQGVSFALNDAVMAVAFLLLPGAWIGVAMPLGYLIGKLGKRPWIKLSFNFAQHFFAIVSGLLVAALLGNNVLGAAVGLATYAVINHLVVAIPVAVTSDVPYRRVLVAMGPIAIIHTAGNASVGLLAGWLAVNSPIGLLGLIVPVGLLWWSYEQQTRRASEAQLFAELARGQERLLGGSMDASAQVVLSAAAHVFGGSQVEMLLRHPDGVMRYVVDKDGSTSRQRVEAEAFDAPWVLRALAARGVIVGHDGPRPYCSAVLGDPEHPQAVLVAYRPEKAAPFTRGDVQLAEVLVRQAESWLSVAELAARRDEAVGRAEAYGAANRVLGEVSQDTVPALAVLRESTHRLSRLATRYDGPDAVDEIVAELYSVERAVASLLGAIALASEAVTGPALTSTGSAPRTEAEWTTTGRLEDAVGP